METHIKIIGIALILLATVHVIFPKYFDWKNDLAKVTLINKEMMYVHTFFLAFILLLMGILCLTSAAELINTNLGKKISLGFAVFWLLRLLTQFFIYSSELWRGKKFETFVHIVFIFLWTYLSLIFFIAFWIN